MRLRPRPGDAVGRPNSRVPAGRQTGDRPAAGHSPGADDTRGAGYAPGADDGPAAGDATTAANPSDTTCDVRGKISGGIKSARSSRTVPAARAAGAA